MLPIRLHAVEDGYRVIEWGMPIHDGYRILVIFAGTEALHGECTDQDDGDADDGPFFHIHALDACVGSVE